MRAWIIAAGAIDEPSFYRSLKIGQDDLVICADGGYDHARLLGIKPSIVIGDMDSVSMPVFEKTVPVLKYPTDKDKTDSQLAVEYALDNNYNEIIILCATGDRIDHTIANIMLLVLIAERGGEGLILNGRSKIALITDKMTLIRGKKSDDISFIPLTDVVEGVTTEGLLYNMQNATLKIGDTLSMSNEFRAQKAHISIKDGKLLVVCSV